MTPVYSTGKTEDNTYKRRMIQIYPIGHSNDTIDISVGDVIFQSGK